jgi:hypothetical protein
LISSQSIKPLSSDWYLGDLCLHLDDNASVRVVRWKTVCGTYLLLVYNCKKLSIMLFCCVEVVYSTRISFISSFKKSRTERKNENLNFKIERDKDNFAIEDRRNITHTVFSIHSHRKIIDCEKRYSINII